MTFTRFQLINLGIGLAALALLACLANAQLVSPRFGADAAPGLPAQGTN